MHNSTVYIPGGQNKGDIEYLLFFTGEAVVVAVVAVDVLEEVKDCLLRKET